MAFVAAAVVVPVAAAKTLPSTRPNAKFDPFEIGRAVAKRLEWPATGLVATKHGNNLLHGCCCCCCFHYGCRFRNSVRLVPVPCQTTWCIVDIALTGCHPLAKQYPGICTCLLFVERSGDLLLAVKYRLVEDGSPLRPFVVVVA